MAVVLQVREGTPLTEFNEAPFALHGSADCRSARTLAETSQEAREQSLEIVDFEPSDVDRFVTYMYTLKYSILDIPSEAIAHLRLYVLADKYDISPLKGDALGKFNTAIGEWDAEFVQVETDVVCDVITKAYESAASPLCERIVSKIASTQVLARTLRRRSRSSTSSRAFPTSGKTSRDT